MKRLFLTIAAALSFATASAQTAVEVNLDTRHKVGDVDSFDRPKFINFHATHTEGYWDRGNAFENLRDEILAKYDVYMGRDTGGLKGTLMSATEDPERKGFVDPAYIKAAGEKRRKAYSEKSNIYKYERYSNLILCNQFAPFYPDGTKNKNGWALSRENTAENPFGTASGEYYGRYVKEVFGTGGNSGEPRPKWLEIINEPLWDIYDMRGAPKSSIRELWEFHRNVARAVRKEVSDIPIGGYVTAFPNFEEQNFERWRVRWREFVDIAGEEIDFWSIHLYDFPVFGGGGKVKKMRKGSNMEATMDMIEQYSQMKFGRVKPLMISEYGAQTHKFNRRPWMPYRDWLKIASMNGMMMQFMQRANNINIAMPFYMLRSDWGYNPQTGLPHTSRIMRREGEPESFTGDYIFGDAILFYQLWQGVRGVRVESSVSNVDLQSDCYIDGKRVYLILNNLDYEQMDVDLKLNGVGKGAKSIELRELYLEGGDENGKEGKAVLRVTKPKSIERLTLGGEATAIIVYEFAKEVQINKLMEETKYYATDYLKEISWAKRAIEFEINDVKKSEQGRAVLRIGLGRAHGKSLKPKLLVNGTEVSIPDNVRGDDQKMRETFFGVLEIPVEWSLIKENNKISLTFPDDGGAVSTVTMQVYNK
ncbi:MAG: hypothetical protein SNG14_01650 [Rikenellaceae bacterium]